VRNAPPRRPPNCILKSNHGADIPAVTRIRQPDHLLRVIQCRLKQRFVGRVTAHHPIQRDDVCGRQPGRKANEVAFDPVDLALSRRTES
jgi:hypothetical protein